MLTKFFKGGDTETVVMIIRYRRGGTIERLGGNGGLGWRRWRHTGYQRLELMVGQRCFTSIALNNSTIIYT